MVVTTTDRTTHLEVCLDRLMRTTPAPGEVIVVDNGSTARGVREIVRRATNVQTSVRLLEVDDCRLSTARNLGWREASGSVIGFLTDDVLTDRRWPSAALETLASHPDAGCVTGLTFAAELTTESQVAFEHAFGWSTMCGWEPFVLDPHAGRHTSSLFPYTLACFPPGAHCVFTRDTLAQLGGFDETLGAGTPAGGGED
ncbi:MAG: glycosyltransferase family 2 protein, partial [Acidimicrobiia bacterium]|nr:glycosyltransferase family 2 protein [Acidimicrobiia bacterium]